MSSFLRKEIVNYDIPPIPLANTAADAAAIDNDCIDILFVLIFNS